MVEPRCRGAVSALGIYNSLQQCADTPLNAQSRRVVDIPTKTQAGSSHSESHPQHHLEESQV